MTRPTPLHRIPAITHHGQPIPRAAYLDRIMRGDWEDRVREFAESGVRCFGINVPHGGADFFDAAFWTDDGVYPENDEAFPLPISRQAEIVQKYCPDAVLFVVCMSSVPLGWSEKHPDQMQTDENGKRYREASLSSSLYTEGLERFLGNVVRYCERQPWSERLAGYYVYPYGEGGLPLTHSGKMFDCSPANDAAFGSWIRERYPDEKSLRRAWSDPAVTFDAVRVPRDREWLARKATATATIGGKPIDESGFFATNSGNRPQGLFHFIEPANAAREQDYCRFMRAHFLRWVRAMHGAVKSAAAECGVERIVGFDILKQPLAGWQIQSAFDGIGDGHSFNDNNYLSGSFDVGELLDEIDMVVTPADYHARTLGFAFDAEGVSDSMTLRGKPMIVENDSRNYVGNGIGDQGAFRDDREAYAGLLRNAALVMSRGLYDYWCNVGSSYFHAPGIHEKTISKLAPALDRMNTLPHRETREAIALVIDDTGPLAEDFTGGYQSLAIIWQRVLGLAHCGIPYRVLLLSDLERSNLPAYRTWLFPNLFKVDDRVLERLRAKVLRDGNLAIFGPATGITDGSVLTAEPASRLLGVEMELHPRTCMRHVIVQDIPGHPITRELSAGFVFGDSMCYGPTLTPGDRAVEKTPSATTLGHANLCWYLHRTGFFINELSDCHIVWSCTMPLPAEVLRACARHSGAHIWSETGDIIYADDSLVAVHTVKHGPRKLRLPRRTSLRDVIGGETLTADQDGYVRLDMQAPETRVFTMTE